MSGGTPRLGFLGVGWIGRHRMQCIADSGAARIAAIADPDPDTLSEAMKMAPGAHGSDSVEELLAQDLDGVVIATPSAQHADQTLQALERGLAVFCQKPLGRSGAEARRVVDAARTANRRLGVDFCYRHVAGMDRIRNHIRDGGLGQVFASRLVFHNAYGPDKPWFYRRDLSGGGCVMDLGIHLVDLALWLLDYPTVTRVQSRCYANGEPLGANPDTVEDYAVARLDLATGATVELACSWNLPAGCDCDIQADFFGTTGGASLRNLNGSFFDFETCLTRGTQRDVLAGPPDAWGGRAAVAWARQLAEDPGFDPAVERTVAVTEVLDRIYRNAA